MGRLLAAPPVHDVVVGDFGRAAALEYVHTVADEERRLVQEILGYESLPFLDEYRRLMFTLLGDLAYFKAPSIDASVRHEGRLTTSVLIGFGDPGMTETIYRRIAVVVIQALVAAVDRGYTRLRVAIPCNRLSDCASYLNDLLASPDELGRLDREFGGVISEWPVLQSVTITAHGVIDSVVRHVQEAIREVPRRVLVLAAPEVGRMYERAFSRAGIESIRLPDDAQDLVNRLVFASIARDEREIAEIRSGLAAVQTRIGEGKDTIVIEACTDFDVDVGVSSLAIYANDMVQDYYARELGVT